MIIRNTSGREFFIRVVHAGDRYGREDCLVHEKGDPLVEFYDATYAGRDGFGPRGQFVSRYNASTLASHRDGVGIRLDGGVPEWDVDAVALRPVVETARSLMSHAVREVLAS